VQRTKGEFLLSLERLHEAEAYCIESGFVNYLPNLYLTIGNVYQLIGEQDLAWENLHEALRRARRGEKFRIMAATMEALGDHAEATGDTAEALCWYETSLQTAHDAQIPSQEGQSSAKASRIYLSLGQMEAATAAAKLAVKLAVHDHDTVSLGLAYYALGLVDLHARRYGSAVQNCERAYRYSRQSSQTNALMEVCDCLWRSGEKAGQGELALHYYREYIGLRDSLFNRDNNMAIARLEARLDYERRHAADSLVQASANLQREATHRAELAVEQEWSRIILWITVAAILMACVAGVGVAVFRRQNGRLSSQNEIIQAQKEAIEQALQEKEVLLHEIHHRVKNNLQVMISLLELQSDGTEDAHAREVLLASRGRVEAMTLIHQKLHQQQNLSGLEFGTYLRQLVGALQEVYPIASCIEIDYQLGECTLSIDTAVPLGLILNELVTNAFKYAYRGREGGKLRVSLYGVGPQTFALVVEDDGMGLPVGFELQKTGSLGLQLVKGLSRQLRGRMVAEKSSMGGAKFVITFQS
jgi:two-component system, sensor histidine kinase PdtaS